MKKQFIAIPILILMLSSCSSSDDKQLVNEAQSIEQEIEDLSSKIGLSEEDKENVSNLLNSIPAPIELAFIVKSLDLNFSISNLNKVENIDTYTTPPKQALNIGVYGANLVYCNVYGRKDLTDNYLEAIQKLFEKLGKENLIDFQKLIGEEDKKKSNQEMAMRMGQEFEKVYDDLKASNQENISVMMLYGGWIESLYLTVKAAETMEQNKAEVIQTIYDESMVLETFIRLFDMLKSDTFLTDLMQQSKELNTLFREINIEEGETQLLRGSENNITVVVEKTRKPSDISEDNFNKLASKISLIRTKIVK